MAKTTQMIIMAAGQGKRMRSTLPKVLHLLAGRPLLSHVIATAQQCSPDRVCVVVGHEGEKVKAAFPNEDVFFVTQNPPKGTGDAVKTALTALAQEGKMADVTLVVNGDCPLIPVATLARLIDAAKNGGAGWLTVMTETPFGLGRMLRNEKGEVRAIVEERDATDAERNIKEINAGAMAAPSEKLLSWVSQLNANNAQGEYYLTDVLPMALKEGVRVETVQAEREEDTRGINDRAQLAEVERIYQRRCAAQLMREGVSLADPTRIEVRGSLQCDADVLIDVGCVFEGKVMIASHTKIGAYAIIKDCVIGAHVTILPFSHLEGATIGDHAVIGPYARIRPHTVIAEGAKVGNFVELKATTLGAGSKANHLSYLGDAVIAENVNIGAGTITCNYDGARKYKTVIERDVFIGSNTALIAPITVGSSATIGAGSTLSEDVPAKSLTFTRTRPIVKLHWNKPKK